MPQSTAAAGVRIAQWRRSVRLALRRFPSRCADCAAASLRDCQAPCGTASVKSEFEFGFPPLARTPRKRSASGPAAGPAGHGSGLRPGPKRVRGAIAGGSNGAGVHPAHQSRSRAKQDALITSGIRMLEERDYRSLSIADLTAANGVSVGAFYARFSGKDAYFNALQRQVFDDVAAAAQTHFAAQAWTGKPARAVLDAFVTFFVALVRRHRGVIFAALQQETAQPTAWTPVRNSGAAVAAPFASVLVPKLTHIPPAQRVQRVGFAVQVLYGTLINAVLHDPGPMALSDPRLAGEMQRVLAAYLDLVDGKHHAAARTNMKSKDKADNGQ